MSYLGKRTLEQVLRSEEGRPLRPRSALKAPPSFEALRAKVDAIQAMRRDAAPPTFDAIKDKKELRDMASDLNALVKEFSQALMKHEFGVPTEEIDAITQTGNWDLFLSFTAVKQGTAPIPSLRDEFRKTVEWLQQHPQTGNPESDLAGRFAAALDKADAVNFFERCQTLPPANSPSTHSL